MLKETTVNQLHMETNDCKIETKSGTGDIKLYAVSHGDTQQTQCNLQCKKGFFATGGDKILVKCESKDARTSGEGDLPLPKTCERA